MSSGYYTLVGNQNRLEIEDLQRQREKLLRDYMSEAVSADYASDTMQVINKSIEQLYFAGLPSSCKDNAQHNSYC